jgi:RNA polymerase sigma-70 factor (ECF subfamily)
VTSGPPSPGRNHDGCVHLPGVLLFLILFLIATTPNESGSMPDSRTTKATRGDAAEDPVVAAATAGDEAAFAELVERHRRELHVHCYRMVGSFEEAEDLVQETFLRAWRNRESFEGGSLFRAWLYRIATNACLDALRRSARQVRSMHSLAEVPWIQPYPDRLLDEIAPSDAEPDAVVVARETIELTFLAVIQLLPPRQRAVLILRDVLEWPAGETATLLDMSVAAANSALQRARATLRERLPARPSDWSGSEPSEQERALLEGFIDAHQRADAAAAAALAREDIRVTMPPKPWCFDGLASIQPLLEQGLTEPGEWRLVPTRANRQPTAASYLRAPGDTEFRAFKLDVLRIEDGLIAEITTFDATLFPAFGLPPTL